MHDATRLPAVPTPDPFGPAALAAMTFLGRYLNRNTRDAYALDLRIFFEWCAAVGIDPLAAKRLLLRRDGSQMTRRSADRVVQRLVKAAGIDKHVSPHSLRRSFATIALQAGVDVRVVQFAMDHASTRTTLGYDRLGVELHAQAQNTVAAMLASAS